MGIICLSKDSSHQGLYLTKQISNSFSIVMGSTEQPYRLLVPLFYPSQGDMQPSLQDRNTASYLFYFVGVESCVATSIRDGLWVAFANTTAPTCAS